MSGASGRPEMGPKARSARKAAGAYRTISEVSDELDVPQHVLRFWETKFNQVRPLKRGGGRRYYRPEDVDLLRRIRALLYRDGYTIKGVQRLLREGGVAGSAAGLTVDERAETGEETGDMFSDAAAMGPDEPPAAPDEAADAGADVPDASGPDASGPDATGPDEAGRLGPEALSELVAVLDELRALRTALRRISGELDQGGAKAPD